MPFLVLVWLGCRRSDVEVVSVTDLGPLETADTIQGRDGGYSTRFGDRSVWVYGDTILGIEGEDGSSWRDNSWSWTEDLDPSDGIDGFTEPLDAVGAPLELFPETADEHAYNDAHDLNDCREEPCGAREILWPMALVADDLRGRLIVFYVKIHGEPGAWNFFDRGYGVALWADLAEPLERPGSGAVADEPTLMFGPDDPAFGDAAAIGPDGLLYAWGRDDDEGMKREMLGRVDPADIAVRDRWTFWDGQGWSASLDDAEPVFTGAAQMSVHHDEALDLWVAVYVQEPFAGHLVVRTAPSPEGPWSESVRLAETLPGEGFPYCGMLHPEYARDGVHLATYYRTTGDWSGELRLLEVELKRR